MKILLVSLTFMLLLGGCKKAVEQAQEDLVVQAMTNGQWAITSFTQNGSNITSNFAGYTFHYYSNKTVDAINNGVVEKTGNWDGDAATMTTSASFSNAVTPLSLINGNWHIDNNSWTYVLATQVNGSETKTMRLDKQ